MRPWIMILQTIADMQPGDIDKLDAEEAELVRKVVDAIESGETMCLDTAAHAILDRGLDKIAPTTH
jgi:hypothetical protein